MPPSPTFDNEVTYISALNPDGTLALNAFAAWNDNKPATYDGGFTNAKKWYANSSSGTAGTPGGTVKYYFDAASSWTSGERQAFEACLALWSAIANVNFELTSLESAGQIIFKRGADEQAHTNISYSVSGGAGVTGGTILQRATKAVISIDTSVEGFGPITAPAGTSFSDYGGYPWQVMMHEIGHALGLGHGGPYPVFDNTSPSNLQYSAYDNRLYTIMSYISPNSSTATYYNEYSPSGTNWGTSNMGGFIWGRQATTWMPVDILAIQRIYGANPASPLSGNNVFGFNSNITGPIAPFFDFTINTRPVVTLWSSGVNNTLDARNFTQGAVVNLKPGTFSSLAGLTNNVGIAQNTRIDKLYTGIGADTVTGNDYGNTISTGGGDDTINAGAGIDTLVGGLGNDTLSGGGNVDTAVFAGARFIYTITQTSIGNFTITGIDGTDTLTGIEYAKFDDQTFRLLPGDGVLVDFAAAPASYMSGIRDFDGNNLIGQGTQRIDPGTGALVGGGPWDGVSGWALAGAADVSGGGLQSRILFNNQVGRWAEVTTQTDGKIYFSNHGWAGDTRIVGIYIDPLVQSGAVVAGSDTDSQRRFQNDLFIGNLKSVLHAADYDKDSGQEIYFSLTDGTAYLHAYMHADGNIRYANYQSKQQVQDYLAANSYGGSVTWLAAAPPEKLAATWTDDAPLMAAADPLAAHDLISPASGMLAGVSG